MSYNIPIVVEYHTVYPIENEIWEVVNYIYYH